MESLGEILRRNAWTTRSGSRRFPPSDLPNPERKDCALCHGVGFRYPELPEEHPDYGRAVPCTCTLAELDEQRLSRLQRYSNLGPLLDLTFENLSPRGQSGLQADQSQFSRAFENATAYAANPQGWFVLIGSSGSGKTHMAAAIANACLARGVAALFVVVPDLLDHLRAAFNPQSGDSYSDLFDQVRNAPLLVLDDLGSQSSTAWAQEKLFQLMNHRYSARLPTVITLNGPVETLDERLRQRLSDPVFAQRAALEQHQNNLLQYQGPLSSGLLAKMTFKDFELNRALSAEQQASLRAAHMSALHFAEDPNGWLVLTGPWGCGKTHLAASIANYRIQQGHPVFFVVVPDLLDHLRATYAPDSKTAYDVLFDRIKTTPLLVLDDLGAQTTTSWAHEKLFQLVNYRYNARLPTVITTSVALAEIPPAIVSRLRDPGIGLVVAIDAPDYRNPTGTPLPSSADQPATRRQFGPRQRKG